MSKRGGREAVHRAIRAELTSGLDVLTVLDELDPFR